jgi:hypothetical protein
VNTPEPDGRPGWGDDHAAFDAGYQAAWQDVAYDLIWPLVARVARYVNLDELAHLTGRAIAMASPTRPRRRRTEGSL